MIFKSNLKERIKKPNCSLKEISEKGLRANWKSIMTRASVKIASMKIMPVKMILKESFKFSLLLFEIGQNSIILHSCTKNKFRKILYEIKSRDLILKASDSSINMNNITIFFWKLSIPKFTTNFILKVAYDSHYYTELSLLYVKNKLSLNIWISL